MVGNVWEWTADVYTVKSLKKAVRSRLDMTKGFKVLKGGSFLCYRSLLLSLPYRCLHR
ncbi:MAG: SUMF1/EgtB/PvdO family nonheme iron enzyme [Pseudomonadota bacterium]